MASLTCCSRWRPRRTAQLPRTSPPSLARLDGDAVAAGIAGLDPLDADRVRALMMSVGTCSTDEPVADLVALGLISEPG